MKLGELRSAIRGHKGTVEVEATLGDKTVTIPVQKTSFLKETLEAFGDHKGVETGLVFHDDGVVRSEGSAPVSEQGQDQEGGGSASLPDEDDDLLGGGGLEPHDPYEQARSEPASADAAEFEDLLG